jgi:hypothetical protein
MLPTRLATAAPDTADYDPATHTCAYTLGSPATCSAGAFAADGRLVRTLFAARPHDAGTYSLAWDGLDDAGKPAPDGCTVRLAVNRGTYTNVGYVGQNPRNPKEHIPASMSSIAVGPSGDIFTANGWDEAGESVSRRNPDGSRRWGYGVAAFVKPAGMPYAIAVDDQYFYAANGCMADTGQRVVRWRYHGPDPDHNDPAPWTGTGQPDGWVLVRPRTDGELQAPLPALAVSGASLWVVDVVDQRLCRYSKATGASLGAFPVAGPRAVAVDPQGRVWASRGGSTVSVYYVNGQKIRDALTGQGTVAALAFSPDGKTLAVADDAAGQVRVYTVADTTCTPKLTIGQKAVPGDRAADRFYRLRSVALLPDGSVLVAQAEPTGGARLAKLDPAGSLAWELYSNEFVSAANYGQADPDTLYSSTWHRYTLKDRVAGTADYAGNAAPGIPLRWTGPPHHPMTVARIGGKDFAFLPANMDLLIALVDGPVLRPVAGVGGADPAGPSDARNTRFGQWSWTDSNDNGQPDADEVAWAAPLGQAKVYGRTGADRSGNLVLVSDRDRSVWTVPLGPLSPKGYPTYDWAQAKQVVAPDPAPGGFYSQLSVLGDDGSLYACGWNKGDPRIGKSPWQASGVLCRFAPDGTKLWAVQPPELICGLDTIPGPGGGVIVGGQRSATLYHYTADGLLVGQVGPGPAMGGSGGSFDVLGAVNVNRDPRDGIVDVFCERVSPGGIAWYRIDDHGLTVPGPAPPAAPPVLTVEAIDDAGVTLSAGTAKATVPRQFLGRVKPGDKVTIGEATP